MIRRTIVRTLGSAATKRTSPRTLVLLAAAFTLPQLTWEIPATSITAARGYAYLLRVDDAPSIRLTSLTCVVKASRLYTCGTRNWPLRCGTHRYVLTYVDPKHPVWEQDGVGGESAQAVLSVTLTSGAPGCQ